MSTSKWGQKQGCPDPTPRPGDSSYVPPQQLTPGGPVHGGFTFTEMVAQEQCDMDTQGVLGEVLAERRKQDEKWGEQNHPILWPASAPMDRSAYENLANRWKEVNASRVYDANQRCATSDRNCSWDGIAFEELYEAFAESDPAKVRAEAVQAAAVLVAMIECIDRNAS